jgi:hypothetical protein
MTFRFLTNSRPNQKPENKVIFYQILPRMPVEANTGFANYKVQYSSEKKGARKVAELPEVGEISICDSTTRTWLECGRALVPPFVLQMDSTSTQLIADMFLFGIRLNSL